MKTLDEIINRQDYVRVNKALAERASELAEKFSNKFEELCGSWDSRKTEFPDKLIEVNGHKYCSKWNIYRDNFEKFTDGFRFVRVKDDPDDYGVLSYSLNRLDYGQEASHKDYVDFLNDAKDILAKLDELETEKVKSIEEALESVKDLK